MKQLVLVTGAGGQLGQAMTARLAPSHEVVTLSRTELDVTDPEAVMNAVTTICPDAVVNCAAYTNVDAAEREPLPALAVNAWAVQALARASISINAVLVHFSTDFVFDGATDRPYTEEDAPNPRSVYASTKLLGEFFAAEVPGHYILRVESLFGGPQARSSVDKMLLAIRSGGEVRAFVDRTVSPSFVDDVVSATSSLLDLRSPPGIYHCVNSGWTTWSGIARELAAIVGKPDAAIVDVKVEDAKLTVSRPQFAALSNAKLASCGITLPVWQDALRRYVAALDEERQAS
jgi:dTDP-4-dehydrorhamnose reductase